MRFKNQNGYWPNIFQASSVTYRKIEIVANAQPENIKGDGSDGMPANPNGFVELSGFQGKEYSLDMCLDEQLEELSYRLVYDSDPDGEYDIEDDEFSKAI
ncbi:MAG: hypothetical protein K2P81_00560 [Bacteriovoracaceae bacterium]|nr:hypothetical protein [Bacteriovoracaceae bacterium]